MIPQDATGGRTRARVVCMQTESVAISSLKPDPENLRLHGDKNLAAIKSSLQRFGQQKPIVIDEAGKVVAGNGTLAAAVELGWSEIQVVTTTLTGAEQLAFAIADNRTAELAEWDEEGLAEALSQIQSDADLLSSAGFMPQDVDDLIAKLVPPEEPYTREIKAPIYEPKGSEPPAVDELTDQSRADALLAEIDSADIPDDVAGFLRVAASRHVVFNYQLIADFYAHADPDLQRLIEASALVIIDFDQAIERGYVELSTDLQRIYGKEKGGQ